MLNENGIFSPEGGRLLYIKNFNLTPDFDQSIGHQHEYLEISLVKSGIGTYYIDGLIYDMQPGDIFTLNNIESHGIKVTGPCSMVNMVLLFEPRFIWNSSNLFDYRYLRHFFERHSDFEHRLCRNHPISANIKHLMYEIEQEFQNDEPEKELLIKVKLMNLLVLLIRYYSCVTTTPEKTLPNVYSYADKKQLSSVMEYIDSNFNKELHLVDLAAYAHMSQSYFSLIFKKLNGVSVSKYISMKRVYRAKEYLLSSNKTIVDIACSCGFNNMSNFYKIFKNLTGVSPSEIRRNTHILSH